MTQPIPLDVPLLLGLATVCYGFQIYYYSHGNMRKEFWACLACVLFLASAVGKWVGYHG